MNPLASFFKILPAPMVGGAVAVLNKKSRANELTNTREDALPRFLNGEDIPLDMFACPAEALHELRRSFGPVSGCKKVGGLGKHYDGTLEKDGKVLRYELKHCEKTLGLKNLEWKPWEGVVQIVQSQFKSKAAQTFLDADAMYLAWFNEGVQPFLAKHDPSVLEGVADMTYEDYFKSSSSLDAHHKGKTPASNLLRLLRSTPALKGSQKHLNASEGGIVSPVGENSLEKTMTLQQELQQNWLRFEESWMPENPLNHVAFFHFLKSIIEEKDIWFTISKSGAAAIEGFNVLGLKYDGISKKPHGGMVYNYTMTLQKKSGGDHNDVKIQFKYTWKNGGQAIQNLNFLVV
jgi:hypothetical protein